jgi:ubiquinone/menaquinone biosynthesis C-methylase UbiE
MSFDRLARRYSAMEWLLAGRKLQTCRTAFLEDAARARSILLVGEGHGKFLEVLCRAAPEATISYVDASVEMGRVARARLTTHEQNRVLFHSIPIMQFEPGQKFDLIVTHFFLDCFAEEELGAVIERLAHFLLPEAAWIIADFQVPRQGWRRWRAQAILALAYSFFRMATQLAARRLVSPQALLQAQGLNLETRLEFNFGLLYAELWKMCGNQKSRFEHCH